MPAVKVIEVVGTSTESWDAAAREALVQAKKTIHGISGVEVLDMTASVEDGEITDYKTTVKIAFKVD